MNRGSNSPSCGAWTQIWSFNEAPIHESGKLARMSTGMQAVSSFNEAPIHESGKCK